MSEDRPTESTAEAGSSVSIDRLERKIAELRDWLTLLVFLNAVLFVMVLILILLQVW